MKLADYNATEETPIIEIIKKLDKNTSGNIFICKDGILLASVTDGDIRRSIMKNVDMQTMVGKIANYSPLSLNVKDSRQAYEVMKREVITAIPIINDNRYVVDIKFLVM